MSAHDHAAGDHDDDLAADHDDHADDHAEPVLPEPESPAWLPLLGGALFLLALLGFLFLDDEKDEASKDAPIAAAAAAAAPPPAGQAAPAAPAGSALAPRLRQMLPGMMAPRGGEGGGPAGAPNRAVPPSFGNPRRIAPGEPPRPNP